LLGLVLTLALGAAGAAASEPERSPSEGAAAGKPAATSPSTSGSVQPGLPDPAAALAPAVAGGIPVYVRPRGAAGGREGGGTRGGKIVEIEALIPEDHAALTTREQPTVYWYLGEPSTERIDFIVNRGRDDQPLFEKPLEGPFAAGIHAVDFKALGIRLEPGVVYKWYVEVIPDPAHRSRDAFAGGTLQRIVPSAELDKSIAAAGPEQLAILYSQNGIWCDALDEISKRIAANGSDAVSLRQRAGLLAQVGLGSDAQLSAAKPVLP
jgi:hypothetical protein